jgi:eukaryotic-like serine/threonine-protein kinase
MATVHLGRLLGPVGFSRTVAIKRLHAQFASDPEFVSMFLDEARLAARIRHPNVVPTLDVVATGGELFLVMEYVPGESVSRLSRALRERQQTIPYRILSAIMAGVLHGLHAAHEAKDERGHPLGIVHRDVSPQNILVGTDGVPRVLDFGVAKAAGRVQTTKEGQIKGKLSYMPPEQLRGAAVSRQTDIYAAGVMLWELVTGVRLFSGDNEGAIVAKVLEGRVEPPSQVLLRSRRQTVTDAVLRMLESLDATILRSLNMQPEQRFATAREMALEIERKSPPATGSEVADWVENVARDVLSSRAQMVAEIESSASIHPLSGGQDHVQAVLNAKATLGPGVRMEPPTTPRGAPQMNVRTPMPPMSGTHGHGATLPLAGYPVHHDPPVTQPSSISVSTASHPGGQAGSGKKTVVAALVGVMLGASVLATAMIWRAQKKADALAVDPATSISQPTPVPSPTPTTPTTPPSSEPTPAEVTAAPDAGPHPKPTSSIAIVPKPLPRPKPAPAPTGDPPPPKPTPDDCSTPYWYDAQGVKRYKAHCLNK